jgi:hypothetical protein
MQIATPFLFPSATVASERSSKKTKSPSGSALNLGKDQALLSAAQPALAETKHEAAIENAKESKSQNLARLLASCCDCV